MTWNDHAANGEAFSAEDFIIGAPGLFAHVQLFNPVDSGKRIRLRSVHAVNVSIINMNVRRYDPPGAILGPPAPFIIENLLGGGPAPVAELRHVNALVQAGSPFWVIQAPASTIAVYPAKGLEWGR